MTPKTVVLFPVYQPWGLVRVYLRVLRDYVRGQRRNARIPGGDEALADAYARFLNGVIHEMDEHHAKYR